MAAVTIGNLEDVVYNYAHDIVHKESPLFGVELLSYPLHCGCLRVHSR